MRYLGFDIEVCSWPKEGDWDRKTLLGISCIGFMGTGWDEPHVIYAGYPNKPQDRAMDFEELYFAGVEINSAISEDIPIVSWNGLQFDFLVMALEHPEFAKNYAEIAINHIDPMFYILCNKGWPVGLDTVAKGLRLSGKTEGMHGSKAPEMWMDGTDEDRLKVLEYVGQDAITTLDIVEVASRTKMLYWFSKSGRPQSLPFEPLTVRECLEIREPDTSWMDNPLKRESFYDWTKSYLV